MAGRAGKKEAGKSKTKPSLKKGVGRAKREKQVEEQTHIALEKYRILFESFPLGISITDKAGNLIETNKESERLLGLTRDGHLYRRYDGPEWQIVRPDGTPMPPEEYASVRALRENRRIENVEMGIVKNGDEITWINVTAEPIPLENYGVAITYGDISARKMLEKNLEKEQRDLKLIIDSSPIIVFSKDLCGRFIRVNKAFADALKISEEEFKGKTVFDLYPKAMAQAMADDDQVVIKSGHPKLNIIEQYESASGTRWVQTDKVPILNENGIAIGLLGFAQDVTERKRAEEALRESEKRVKMKLDAILAPQGDIGQLDLEDILDIPSIQSIMDDFYKLTNVSAWILDLKGNILVSTGWRDICTQFHRANIETCENCIASDTQLSEGVEPGTFKIYKCKNNMWDLVTPIVVGGRRIGNLFLGQFLFDDETMDYECFRSQARRYGFDEAEYLAALERVPRWSRETIKTSTDFYSKFAQMISTLSHSNIALARSLTEKDGLLSALQASEAQYRLLSEHMTDTVWLMDMNLKTTYQSPSVQRVRGFTPLEIDEMPLEKHLTPESLKRATDVFLEEMAKVEADPGYDFARTLELEFYRKDGTIFWSENTFSLIRDEDGRPLSILGEGRDITERKLVEEALLKEKRFTDALIDSLPGTFYVIDDQVKYVRWNKNQETITGYSADEMHRLNPLDTIVPDDRDRVSIRTMEAIITGIADMETTLVTKDGRRIPFYLSLIPLVMGDKTYIVGVGIDITERKQAEESMRLSEARYRTVLEQIEEAYYEVDLAGNLTFFNDATCHQLGYTAEELMGMNYRVYTSKDDLQREYEIFNEVYQTGKPNTGFSISRIRKDGTPIFTENSALPLRNEDGRIIGFRGVARDITERKRAEEAIRKSEAQYRLLAEHTTDFIWLMDMDLKPTYQSPSAEKLTGFTHEELIALPFEKRMTPESLQLAANMFLKEMPLVEADSGYNPTLTLELEVYRKNGTTLWSENKFTIIRDENGKAVSILGEARDITRHKQAEEALRQSEVKYGTVLEQIEEAYYEVDLAGNLTFFNDATCHQLGYTAEELMGMNYRVYISKDDMQRVYEIYNQVYRTGTPKTGFPVSGIRKDGSRLFTENSVLPMRDKDGKIIGFRGVVRDISERLRAVTAIRESEAQYRLLSEHTTDSVWLMDMNLKTTYTSPSSEKLTGFTQQELIAMPLEKYIMPDSLKLAMETFLKEMPIMEADPDYNPVFRLELEYYRKDGTTFWAENKFNLIRDENGKPVSILGETRDITERREAEEKLEQALAAVEKTLADTVIAISKMVEMKDPFTAGHQIRVAQLASAIGKKMNLTDEQTAILNTAATIHDIGKIYVPSDILSKPGKLNPLEYEIIQTHVRGSYEILKEIDFAGPIAEIVFQHHERMDGSGYPRALKGEDILPEAKILIVADVVEAMSSHRPYRAAMGIEKALAEITLNRGKLYDEAAVDACLELFRNNEFAFKSV